ncbi:MAG: thioesterase family protein [Acidimicrobiaceae bacterium]|nr:thioesterase family protein [Acidimicrobiaceae bacterium]
MDSRSFLGLNRIGDSTRFEMQVVNRISTNGSFLFGGAGLGAGISALETVSQRNLVWATAQYLSFARTDEMMTIDVTLAIGGHQITQGRAVCRVGDREILTVNAALGDRNFESSGQFAIMPDVKSPELTSARQHRHEYSGTIHESLEQRLVKGREMSQLDGTPSDGNVVMWARIPAVIEGVDATALGILGDFVPMAVGQALGIAAGGNSLDNTIRIVKLVPTQWVLLDIYIDAVQRGFGHGRVNMFAEDGTLMATASQSCKARKWKN